MKKGDRSSEPKGLIPHRIPAHVQWEIPLEHQAYHYSLSSLTIVLVFMNSPSVDANNDASIVVPKQQCIGCFVFVIFSNH